MPLDRFMIAPIQGGLQTDLKPWLVPDDAFAQMNNMYIFRGRFRKRFGSRYMNSEIDQRYAQLNSRVCITLGAANAGTLTIPGAGLAVGQMFSIGTDMFTIYQLGAAALTLSTNAGATATINSTSTPNTVTFTGYGAATPVYYYPSTPIMGIITYETTDSTADLTFIWDTQFAYQFTGGQFQRLGTALWTGTDYQFFSGITWNGATPDIRYLFVTNNNPADGIKYYNGTDFVTLNPNVALLTPITVGTTDGTGAASGTVPGAGAIGQVFVVGAQIYNVTAATGALTTAGSGAGTFNVGTGAYTFTGAAKGALIQWYQVAATLVTCQLLVVFKNRLIALNTTEKWNYNVDPVRFTNRARWAAFGDPTSLNSWTQTLAGFGNAIDADTMEDIVSCGFIKDRLIVYFERSTYELVFTGNQAQPFTWQKLNNELGAESTFSSVQFDKVLLTVGNVGIHACNGVNVQRIDDKIPDTVWQIHDGNTEVNRVYGIRDYFSEQVYWTFPNISTNPSSAVYPNKVLVYNYKTGSWAFNDDSITAFGYYYATLPSAVTWSSTGAVWNSNEISWNSGTLQAQNQEILAGNQQGYVFIIDASQAQNAPVLQITDIALDGSKNVVVTCINHNLNVGDYVYIQFLNGLPGPFLSLYRVDYIATSSTFIIIAPDIQGVLNVLTPPNYTGGGTIARLSQVNVLTKQFNFYVDQDRNATVQRVDFLVDRTTNGEFTVDFLTSTTNQPLLTASQENGSLLGTGIVETSPYPLYPSEAQQDRLWHPTYLCAEGNAVQLNIYLSDEQMTTYGIVTSPLTIHAMTFYCQPTSARMQ